MKFEQEPQISQPPINKTEELSLRERFSERFNEALEGFHAKFDTIKRPLGAIAATGALIAAPAAVAGANDSRGESRDWPAINPENNGNLSPVEQNIADFCKNGHGQGAPIVTDIDKSRRKKVAKVDYTLDSMMDCNGYGRRTISMRIETKRPGQKKYHSGKRILIRTHDDVEETKSLKMAQACKRTNLIARTVSRIYYKHMDGTKQKRTVRSSKFRLSC